MTAYPIRSVQPLVVLLALSHTLLAQTATVTLSVAPNPSVYGAPVALTAAVTPASATGRVTFYDGVTVLGTSMVSSGTATLSTIMLPAGNRSLTANYYTSDATFPAGRSAVVTQQVGAGVSNAFKSGTVVTPGISPSSVAVGDFNGDGKLDMALTAQYGVGTSNLAILLGNGDGTFRISAYYLIGIYASFIAVADFNGDGISDLVILDNADSAFRILLGNGDGTFQPPARYPVSSTSWSLAVGDFNGDGKPDLALAGGSANSVIILLGNGDGTFQDGVSYPNGSAALSVAVGDFNGDGRADLAVGGVGSVNILQGNGDGIFGSAVTYPEGSSAIYSIVAGDLNGDGKTDLAVANDGSGNVGILLGNGDGTFQTPVNYSVGSQPRFVALADFNGDGKTDIAVQNASSGTVSILPGNGDGTFQTAQTHPVYPGAFAAGDVNGDGKTDLIVAGPPGANILLGTSSLAVSLTHTGNFALGQSQTTYTATVANGAAAATSGAVTVTEVTPAGLTLISMMGTGWACSGNTCSRADALSSGSSYPPISITVSVASDAPFTVTNQVTVSGGGSPPASAFDPTTITSAPTAPVLTAPANRAVNISMPPTLTWNAVARATYYLVQATGLPGGFSRTTIGTSITVPADYLAPGTLYSWSVTAYGWGQAVSATWTFTTAGTRPPFACQTNVTATPEIRAEGFSESVGDITLSCIGSTPLPLGGALPVADIIVTLNTAVTSRLLPAGNTSGISEALLLIDEPGSGISSLVPGFGPQAPQTVCPTPLAACTEYVSSVTPSGVTPVFVATNTPQGNAATVPGYNVFQGVVSGNSVIFHAIPVLTVTAQSEVRTFRIINIHADATQVPLTGQYARVAATLGLSGAAAFPINYQTPTVAFAQSGLAANTSPAPTLSQCSTQSKTAVNLLSFAEGFGTAFKTRMAANSNTPYAGQIATLSQNIPGSIYNSESDFTLPMPGGQTSGLSDFGTRLKAQFSKIPAGVRLFVSVSNVVNMAVPVTPPAVIGGSAGNYSGTVGFAQLTQTETSAFSAVSSTDYAGNVPIVEIPVVNGSASAVWEVINTNPIVMENLKFGVYTSYGSIALPGTILASLNFAPNGPDSAVLPSFASAPQTLTLFTSAACSALLNISSTHAANFQPGQTGAAYTVTVSNAAAALPTSGAVTMTETVPDGLTLVSMSGTGWTCLSGGTTCTRSDALVGGASYPPIAVMVNVTAAASSVINQVTAAGGGSPTAIGSDPTLVGAAPALSITKTHGGNFAQGQNGAAYSVTVSNASGAGATSGTVTVTETMPAGLTLVSMSGPGWTCATGGTICTRSDALLVGANYPAITVTVNVAANATSPQVNAVGVSGGGSLAASAADSTTIVPSQWKVAKAHSGYFVRGQVGATYTVIVSNGSVSASTSGAATVTETVPTGLTLVSMAGSGWTYPAGGIACTRTDTLAAGASYPAITVTVNVASDAASQVTNQVNVSGGGSGANATDPATVLPPTSTTLVVAPLTSILSQAVTLTASVTAGATGKVTFYDGTTVLGVSALAGGPAVFTTRLPGAGPHGLHAHYSGDGTYGFSDSATVLQTVTSVPGTGFKPRVSYNTGLNPRSAVVGDFNGDGRSDLAVANGSSNTISILLGNGDGTFQTPLSTTVGYFPAAVAIADFNQDGKVDLAVATQSTNTVSILLGNGDGTFQTPLSYPVDHPSSVAVADFNGDGIADLAVPNSGANRVSILLGNGDGTFQIAVKYPVGSVPTSLAIGDLNGDGKADLAVANSSSSTVSVLVGNGDGSFQTAVDYTVGTYPYSIAVADLNGDGKADLAVGGAGWNLSVLLGNGDGTFRAAAFYPPGGGNVDGVSVGDFNGDGKLDLALAVYGGTAILLSNGDGSFQTPSLYGVGSASVAVGDFDGDGRADLVAPNLNDVAVSILMGAGPALTVVKTHLGNFVQGQPGATYTVTVSNQTGGPSTSGTVTMTETVPAGLTLVSMAGTGWTCPSIGNTCTRSDTLAGGASYPAITVMVNVAADATSPQVNAVTVSGGGSPAASATDSTTIIPAGSAALSVTKTHGANFTNGQMGAAYTVTVSNQAGAAPTSGTVTLMETVPAALNLISMAGNGWTCPGTAANNCTRSDVLAGGASYPLITVTVNVAGNATSPQINQVSVSGGGSASANATDPTTILVSSPALRFVSITSCRVADTRRSNLGAFGAPSIAGGTSRDFIIPNNPCGVPATAQAYSFNVAVVPQGPLGFLTLYPAGQTKPVASTLNSLDGRTKSNAAIVPAGTGGAISVFASNTTDVVLDINGYFVSASDTTALAFYPITPCRLVDTRKQPPTVPIGGPSLVGQQSRTFAISGNCNLPAAAQAYSLNFAAVPIGALGFLTAFPTGQSRPVAANLNALTGTVTANAAIVPAGTNGSIDVFASNDTNLVIDVNGYFAPMTTGGLSLYMVTQCRVVDTRKPVGSTPINTLDVAVSASACGIPGTAQAYVFSATVVPPAALGFLTLWPQGQNRPGVATLNAVDGAITSNMAIVPTTNRSISAFGSNPTHLVLDILGYFGQ